MLRTFLIYILLLLQAGCTLSNSEHMNELEDQAENDASHEGVIHKDIVYKSTLFHNITLDIYEPLHQKYTLAPIYIYIHGGSWLHGDKELLNLYAKSVQRLREEGVAVVSIDYRFISQSGITAMISDCKDAVLFLQENAQKYHLDPHFIGLHGHSAGANLALVTGFNLTKEKQDIRFIVDEYGPTDVLKLIKENENRPWWTVMLNTKSLEALSPVKLIHPKIPPVYIAHGDVDKMVPFRQSQWLYDRLKKNNTEVSLEVLKGADHSYEGIDEEHIALHRKKVLAFILAQFEHDNK